MIGGFFSQGGRTLPCIVDITIARYDAQLPKPGETLKFLVSIHVEGTGVTWQQNVKVSPATEQQLLDLTQALFNWSSQAGLTKAAAKATAKKLGRELYKTFIGMKGKQILDRLDPTAILLNVDETIQNLPWELMGHQGDPMCLETPLGRLVTTRELLRPNRDPLQEDRCLRILVVADTTGELAGQAELEALQALQGQSMEFEIKVEVLSGERATIAEFKRSIAPGDYDIIHFSGHAVFDRQAPEQSALAFYDGVLKADEILTLDWKAPPYFVFNSACESGRAGAGRHLVSKGRHSSGLASAFIAAGVSAYAGYYWPVSDVGAGIFSGQFYQNLFARENVGLAFLEARKQTMWELEGVGDLTGLSAILFGDAASSERRDLYAMAEPPEVEPHE